MKDTHPQVKFDVFERLNTGAVKLTAQELRHGMYHGELLKFIGLLAKNKRWRSMLALKVDKRMRSEEFVLRFLALSEGIQSYAKPLSAFLNTFCESHRDITQIQRANWRNAFEQMVVNVSNIFGDFAFKVFDVDRVVTSTFNAALFDAEVLSVANLSTNVVISDIQRERLLNELSVLFRDSDFQKSITRATSDEKQVQTRVEKMAQLVGGYL